MSYSIDLGKRVVDYVENGGRIAPDAVLFQVGRATNDISVAESDKTSSNKSKKT